MSYDFLTRRVRFDGRRIAVRAPAGDPAFQVYRWGRFRGYRTLCRGLLDREAVVLDIGANIGMTALVAAGCVPAGRVLAVEGSPRNHRALVVNLAEHAPGIALALHRAVGAEAGEVRFVDNSAFGHVAVEGSMLPDVSTTVAQTTIDALVAEHDLPRLDLIKLDIEGLEEDALRGAQATLARFDPVVFVEFNALCQITLYDRNPRRLLDFLLDTFPELHVWRHGRLTSLRQVGPMEFLRRHLVEHGCVDDLVAVRDPARLDGLRGQDRASAWLHRLLRRA